jgi:hypothetical protein
MLECETWYELNGRRHNEQRFLLPREDLESLRHAIVAIRRRNSAFHIRLKRPATPAPEARDSALPLGAGQAGAPPVSGPPARRR